MAYQGRKFFSSDSGQQNSWRNGYQTQGNPNQPRPMNFLNNRALPGSSFQNNKGTSGPIFRNNNALPGINIHNNRSILPTPSSFSFGGNQSKNISRNQQPPFTMESLRRVSASATNNGINNRKRLHSSQVIDLTSSAEEGSPSGKRQKHASNICGEDDNFTPLTEDINGYFRDHRQSQEFLDKKLKLLSALQDVIRRKYPNVTLHLVGSSVNGFGSDTSDADLCLILHHDRNTDQKVAARRYLRAIEGMIRPLRYIKSLQFIPAKVPILKFTDTISGCECDMNINNDMGIRNTHLLRCYSKLDDRVRPMVMAIKRWGKLRGINDASQGTLSSYALVLMILHYLQCGCNPPVLYSLQKRYPQHFRKNSNVEELPMVEPADVIPCNTSNNKQSIGALLVGFFRYFAEHFRWETQIMSVSLACTQTKKNNSEFVNKYVAIEEPFEGYNVARAVHRLPKYQMITKEFRRANQLLKEKLSMEHIC